MHISCLIYRFLEIALFWDVSASFWFFFWIINRESHGVVFVSKNEKRLKIEFTDKSKANLWIHLDLVKVHCLKGLTSLYIISYLLFFVNLNNILTLPKILVDTEARFGLTRIMFTLLFACQIYVDARYFTKSKQMQAEGGRFFSIFLSNVFRMDSSLLVFQKIRTNIYTSIYFAEKCFPKVAWRFQILQKFGHFFIIIFSNFL